MRLSTNQRLILGPPGCGKTTTLLGLVDQEMTAGVPASRIAYFSFTKKATVEAKTRAVDRFGLDHDELRYFRTIHSMAFELGGFKRSDVMGLTQYKELGEAIGVEFGGGAYDETTGMPVGNAEGDVHLFVDNLARARMVSLLEQWEDAGIPDLDYRAVERTASAVRKFKEASGLVDFTDMLERYCENGQPLDIDVAFVDEAQDLSALQWKVLARMLSRAERVFIAGDDDQAIYRWSGADVETFLSLEGEQQVLKTSHRCAHQIHAIANSLTDRIGRRFKKDWSPKDGERGRIARVHTLDSFNLEDLEGSTLLLARNTYLLAKYHDELRKRGLPYLLAYGAHSVPRHHARAIYTWVKLARGEPATGAEVKTIYDQLRVGIGVKRGFKALPGLRNDQQVTAAELAANHGLLTPIKMPWFEALDGIAGKDRAYYRSILRGKRSLVDQPSLQVNTIHGVKGGEADNVIINPDMAWKSYAGYQKEPDDEHRVAYVGVSRARRQLFILTPSTKNYYPYLVNM